VSGERRMGSKFGAIKTQIHTEQEFNYEIILFAGGKAVAMR